MDMFVLKGFFRSILSLWGIFLTVFGETLHHCYFAHTTDQQEWLTKNTLSLSCPSASSSSSSSSSPSLYILSAISGYTAPLLVVGSSTAGIGHSCPSMEISACETELHVVNITCAGKSECLLFHQPLPMLDECRDMIEASNARPISFLHVRYQCQEAINPVISVHRCLSDDGSVTVTCPPDHIIQLANVYTGYSPRVNSNCPPTIYQCIVRLDNVNNELCVPYQGAKCQIENELATLEIPARDPRWPLCTQYYTTNFVHVQYMCINQVKETTTETILDKSTTPTTERPKSTTPTTERLKATTAATTQMAVTDKTTVKVQILSKSTDAMTTSATTTTTTTIATLTSSSTVSTTTEILTRKTKPYEPTSIASTTEQHKQMISTFNPLINDIQTLPTTTKASTQFISSSRPALSNSSELLFPDINNQSDTRNITVSVEASDPDQQITTGVITGIALTVVIIVMLVIVFVLFKILRKNNTKFSKFIMDKWHKRNKDTASQNYENEAVDKTDGIPQSPFYDSVDGMDNKGLGPQYSQINRKHNQKAAADYENDNIPVKAPKPEIPVKPLNLLDTSGFKVNPNLNKADPQIGIVQPNCHLALSGLDSNALYEDIDKELTDDSEFDTDDNFYDDVAPSELSKHSQNYGGQVHYIDIQADEDEDEEFEIFENEEPAYDTIVSGDSTVVKQTEYCDDDNELTVCENEVYDDDEKEFVTMDTAHSNGDNYVSPNDGMFLDNGSLYDEVCV